jgi:hypothetical protein
MVSDPQKARGGSVLSPGLLRATIRHRFVRWSFSIVVLTSVAGCVGSTAVQSTHPLVAKEGASEIATVYFIRPDPGFYGVMNMPVSISIGGAELLKLAKGQYTLVRLAPGVVTLRAESFTVVPGGTMTKVSTDTQLSFSEGVAQYFVLEMHIFYEGSRFFPRAVSRNQALELIQRLTPVGAAIGEPISE